MQLIIACCYIQAIIVDSPGSTIKVALLLIAGVLNNDTLTPHRIVVPLFTDVAGTVRLDCTVSDEDVTIPAMIPRDDILERSDASPSTSHTRWVPVPAQWNVAFIPISVVTDTGPSMITIKKQ